MFAHWTGSVPSPRIKTRRAVLDGIGIEAASSIGRYEGKSIHAGDQLLGDETHIGLFHKHQMVSRHFMHIDSLGGKVAPSKQIIGPVEDRTLTAAEKRQPSRILAWLIDRRRL